MSARPRIDCIRVGLPLPMVQTARDRYACHVNGNGMEDSAAIIRLYEVNA
jgi:hypothetical protein